MLERQIEQLLEKEIYEIIIVVGYLKEKFDYLIDKYPQGKIKLVYNKEYAVKNNLASLYCVLEHLESSYILCADHWMENNLFNKHEVTSWYSCSYFKGKTTEWCVEASAKGRRTKLSIGGEDSLALYGPVFFTKEFSKVIKPLLVSYYLRPDSENFYWENVFKDNLATLPMYVNEQTDNVKEFENLAELRLYDKSYEDQTNSKILETISGFFGVCQNKIRDIEVLKQGVSNQSFLFSIDDGRYVFRLPKLNFSILTDRKREKKIYEIISKIDFVESPKYFNIITGEKISQYYPSSAPINLANEDDLLTSLKYLRNIHKIRGDIPVGLNIKEAINYYYELGKDTIRFEDIKTVKKNIDDLLGLVDKENYPKGFCHGDFSHSNILKLADGKLKIIDWEYSGKGDVFLDIASLCIHSYFDRSSTDRALELYLANKPDKEELKHLYLYMSLVGFLWSLWSEYMQNGGQEFGEYPLKMYRYAKDYYNILSRDFF